MKPARASKPMLVDDSLNKAFAMKYVVYALFGVSGVLTHIPSIALIAGEAVATVLAGIIAASSAVAAYLAWNYLKQPLWRKWEFYSTVILTTFTGVYVGALILLAFMGQGNRINLAIIATALIIMPIWRMRFILKDSNK